jgi:thiopeptide-type bacteriocin biosynthesis protein
VSRLSGDTGADLRWRSTLYGIDRLMDDFGLDLVARRHTLRDMHEDLWRELRGGKALQLGLDRRFRRERQSLVRLLGPVRRESERFVHEALDRRRDRARGAVARLKGLEAAGQLLRPMAVLVRSFVHMHANRLLRSAARAHELVIYDFLARIYESDLAQRRRMGERLDSTLHDPRTDPGPGK